MPRQRFYIDKQNGRNSNSGLYPGEALQDWEGMEKKLPSVDPGDEILFKRGQEHEGEFVMTRSGDENADILIGTFGTGREGSDYAATKSPNTGAHVWEIRASHVKVKRLVASGGKAGFYIPEQQGHNTVDHCKTHHASYGTIVRGSYNTFDHFAASDLVLEVDKGNIYDRGAVGIQVEAKVGYKNTGNRFNRPYTRGCRARKSGDSGQDGGSQEFFNEIEDCDMGYGVHIEDKGGTEFGGNSPSDVPNWVMPVMKRVKIHHAVYIDCGVLAHLNSPQGVFPFDLEDCSISSTTVINRARNRDAIWWEGAWGSDLHKKLVLTDNNYYGIGKWVGTDKPKETNLNSITRSRNNYERVNLDGTAPSTDIGYAILAEQYERYGSANMWDVMHNNFWLREQIVVGAEKMMPGALTLKVGYRNTMALRFIGGKITLPMFQNDIKGGHHVVDHHVDMWGIYPDVQTVGMTCGISEFGEIWKLGLEGDWYLLSRDLGVFQN